MTMKRFSAVLLITFLALACRMAQPPPVDTSAADEAAMSQGTDAWFAAVTEGKPEVAAALYTTDAVVMPPHAPIVNGREAMQAFLTSEIAAMKAGGVTLVNGPSTGKASGNIGWHQGTYTVKTATGETVDSGSYLEIWQKGADGKWLIHRDIWNSDRPASPPAPAPAS